MFDSIPCTAESVPQTAVRNRRLTTMLFAGALLPPAGGGGVDTLGIDNSDAGENVVYCTFPLGGVPVRCRCALKGQRDQVEVTTAEGHMYAAALPCRASRLFTLGSGLLVERAPFAEELPALQSTGMFFRPDGKMPKDVQGALGGGAQRGVGAVGSLSTG